eukprot:2730651-Prymnesium_polylepis.1
MKELVRASVPKYGTDNFPLVLDGEEETIRCAPYAAEHFVGEMGAGVKVRKPKKDEVPLTLTLDSCDNGEASLTSVMYGFTTSKSCMQF